LPSVDMRKGAAARPLPPPRPHPGGGDECRAGARAKRKSLRYLAGRTPKSPPRWVRSADGGDECRRSVPLR
jgi:hypothetical protein